MTKPTLHPWLDTPEAVKAARSAVRIPEFKFPKAAQGVGSDELFSEALSILTECALPPRERGNVSCAECGGKLEEVRPGAAFCSVPCRNRYNVRLHRARKRGTTDLDTATKPPKTHIGSMWSWPEDERSEYAAREVGLRLCHYLVTRAGKAEAAHDDDTLDRAMASRTLGQSAEEAFEALECERALEAYEATDEIPWDLLSDADVAALVWSEGRLLEEVA